MTTNLFEALRESHELQRNYCQRMLASRKPAVREALFLQLKIELEAHAAAEERHLYVPLLMTDGGLDASRHALKEHHDIADLCEELSVADKLSAGWMKTAKALSHKVHHHLKEEETKFFQVAGRQLSEKTKMAEGPRYVRELVRMRSKYAEHYRTVSLDADGELVGKGRGAVVRSAASKPAKRTATKKTTKRTAKARKARKAG